MLEDNPCRRHAFEVFRIDKSATDLRAIRSQVKSAREAWDFDKHAVTGLDGVPFEVDEARLNELEKRLFDPLERLKEEQFVHQAHPFGADEELAGAIKDVLSHSVSAAISCDARALIAGALGPLLPEIPPPAMPDDLPDPKWPAAFPIERESLEQAIMRDF